jgi:hypothetical protein
MALTKAHNRMIAGDTLNILDFGASTSSSDNTAAIQSAFNAGVSQGKSVYMPNGIYTCTSEIAVNFSGAKSLKIFGEAGGRAGENLTAGVAVLYFTGITGTDIGLSFDGSTPEEYMGLYLKDFEIRGPSLQAGTPTNNSIGLYINRGRDVVLDNIHIAQFRTGLKAEQTWTWHDMNCKIDRCQVGIIWTNSAQAALHTKLRVNNCTYGIFQESSGHTYVDPWFEGQGPTNTREMETAIVIGGASGTNVQEITFIDGWWEQIQNYAIKVGYYDDGNGAGSGATPNLVTSLATIDDIRISTYGHWDSVGADVGNKKIEVNSSATNIVDYAVRIDGELSNFDWRQVSGNADKITSTYNFQNQVDDGQKLSSFTTSLGTNAQGNCWAGMKPSVADNTATDVIRFNITNNNVGAMFRLDYMIITDTERTVSSGSVIIAMGRKVGLAAQGSVGTPTNINLNISSTETQLISFALNGFQAKDTSETGVETPTLRLTQNNDNSTAATFTWKLEELSSERQINLGPRLIEISQP